MLFSSGSSLAGKVENDSIRPGGGMDEMESIEDETTWRKRERKTRRRKRTELKMLCILSRGMLGRRRRYRPAAGDGKRQAS